jgi:hypothetical protein
VPSEQSTEQLLKSYSTRCVVDLNMIVPSRDYVCVRFSVMYNPLSSVNMGLCSPLGLLGPVDVGFCLFWAKIQENT